METTTQQTATLNTVAPEVNYCSTISSIYQPYDENKGDLFRALENCNRYWTQEELTRIKEALLDKICPIVPPSAEEVAAKAEVDAMVEEGKRLQDAMYAG